MKRISLILSALMLLSFGLVQAQSAVELSSNTGFVAPNYIGVGQPFTLEFRVTFILPGERLAGLTNGIELSSPDGATWGASTQLWIPGTTYATQFGPGVMTVSTFSVDGAGADTIGFGGVDFTTGDAPPSGTSEVTWRIQSSGIPVGDTGKTFCIDSAFFPPAGDWLWGTNLGSPVVPAWGGGIYSAVFTAGQGYCFEAFLVPNLSPVFTSGCVDFGGPHCAILQHTFQADDPDSTANVSYSVTGGVGTINASSGAWSYQPTCADVGQNLFTIVTATDVLGATATCSVGIAVTNVAPTLTTGCGSVTAVGKGLTGSVDVNATANDCDPLVWSLGTVTPAPVGTISIDGNGNVTFITDDPGDGGILYTVPVIVSDCAGGADTCNVQFDVLILSPFEVRIEKTHNTIQGQHEYVDVILQAGSQPLGGFDFLISYDASALQFVAAIEGPDFYVPGCGWEYFTYRYSAFGNCGNACASGKLRVVGIAETNNGANHPDCFLPPTLPAVMFTLDFLVSDNRTFECQYAPIRFVWFDCGDNTISSPLGDTLYISRNVIDFDLIGNIADSTGTYPTWNGAQLCDNPNPNKPDPVRFIDFYNGGIDIVCADSIDGRGDINLNEIENEIADAVLFSNYFVYGLSVFNVNVQGQIAASDVNADGIALSVADLVYLIRVVIGDANPYPKVAPTSIAATYTVANGEISIDATVAAAAIVVEGNVTPTLLADNMNMISNFDGTNTRILVYTNVERGSIETFSGSFISVDGNVISAEFATAEGGVVNAAGKLVAKNFVLNQNYPNPFNPKTRISFSLPKASEYTLTIYNITGQKVKEVSGAGVAGINELDWDATSEASGIYFYKLNAGTFSATKKMVFLK